MALLAGGHVLLEGVPGLAKTLTVKTRRRRARRLVQAPAVHARPRAGRPRRHAHLPAGHRRRSTPSSARCSATSCSPTRSTARPPRCSRRCSRSCRSARSRSATRRTACPQPFLVLATQNPIESEGTYPLPEAQVDRFMFKLVVDYPDAPRRGRGRRALARRRRPACARCSRPQALGAPPARRARGLRRPARHGVRGRADHRHARARGEAATGSSSAPARAARSTSSTPAARWRCCAGATTCCPSTCATSRATCCATASCSPTRRWPPASTPTACSTTCSSACRCRASSSRTSERRALRTMSFREPLAPARRWRSSRSRRRPTSLAQRRRAALRGPLHERRRAGRVAGRSWGAPRPGAARAAGARRAADRARRGPQRTVAAEQREAT